MIISLFFLSNGYCLYSLFAPLLRDNTKLTTEAEQKARKGFSVEEAALKFSLLERLENVETRLGSSQANLRGPPTNKDHHSSGTLALGEHYFYYAF